MATEPQKIGKYELVRQIAVGGMAEIWLASQQGPGGFSKQLVIKRVLPQFAGDARFTDMFLDEARLVAQLSHPNIGQIFDLGEVDGGYFIAMEYIEGMDLADLIEIARSCGEPLPAELVAYIVSQMLQGLEHAHNFIDQSGAHATIVHRDVTPHNVLISNDGAVKLVDFGVARARENRSKTQAGAVKGKFAYMAPEQINGDLIDRRVDLFATGIVLFEALTGELPFGDDLAAVNNILTSTPPDPQAMRPDVPDLVCRILDFALAKNPDDRYQTAQDMLEDLEEVLRASLVLVNQRTLADFIRRAQGLDLTGAYAAESVRVRVITRENADLPPRLSEPTEIEPEEGAYLTPVEHALAADTAKNARGSKLIVAGFLGILGAIMIAGVAILALMIGTDDGTTRPPPDVVAHKPAPPAEPQTKPNAKPKRPAPTPAALRHNSGAFVTMSAAPGTRIYYKGTYVGDPGFQTKLRPGTYELRLEKDTKSRLVTFTVLDKRSFQNINLETL